MKKIYEKNLCRMVLTTSIAILIFSSWLFPVSENWQNIEKKAQGQTVFFHAWGGLESINQYLGWARKEIQKRYGVELKHVKVTDTSLSVKQIISDSKTKAKGSVDLIWINGENFKTLKKGGLLTPKLDEIIPGVRKINYRNNPSAQTDFSEPVDGFEIPWGTARFVYLYDTSKLPDPPQNHLELLSALKEKKVRFTYPAPPEFHGTTFLKQLLYETIDQENLPLLSQQVSPKQFPTITKPLWDYLDRLHPHLWRGGRNFPSSLGTTTQLFKDSEILLSLTFNPNFAENQICLGEFPETVKSYSPKRGGIGNTHFLGIPNNSKSKEGAMVVIDFLISAEAQARKFDSCQWGDPTVLDIEKLSSQEKKFFSALPRGVENALQLQETQTLLEPHASWTEALEKEWIKRYGY